MTETIMGILVAFALSSVGFAARSAPEGLHLNVPRFHLVCGAALSTIGIGVMALAAWSTHEDRHYDDFGSALTTLAAVTGGALLLLGQGPFVPWLLGIPGRRVVRLPPPLRMAVRDVAVHRARTTPAVATTMVATALAITTMIVTAATTAQNRAMVVTAKDVESGEVTIHYGRDSSRNGESPLTRTVPAIAVKPDAPLVAEPFLPAKVVQDLGHHLEPEKSIIGPSVHRTSAIEQERIERRRGEAADAYAERGFQTPAGRLVLVAVLVSVALGGALAMTVQATGSRSRRVLLRAGGGGATLRLFAACRAGLGAACGTAMGAFAGCVIGLLLAWPMTASIEWDPMPRVAFDTPWPPIAALVVGLPVLAAVAAGLAPPRVTVRPAPPGEPAGR